MSTRIAVIGAVLDHPEASSAAFNALITEYKHLVYGRMGIPFHDEDMSVISITVRGSLDDINALTGKLGKIPHVTVKTSISKKELADT